MADFRPSIQLASGSYFFYDEPGQSRFTIEDIAVALGKICRFNGHCNGFYSVAEHSVYVSKLVPPEDALAALLHDAPEAFIGDMAKPLKILCYDYQAIEAKVEKAVFNRFGLSTKMPGSVKVADMIMLATEQKQLMSRPNDHWPMLEGYRPIDTIKIKCMSPPKATQFFLDRFEKLAA
jgi:hypothetical protein